LATRAGGARGAELIEAHSRAAARLLRSGDDMTNHAVASGAHAQALDADFIPRFGIAGPIDEALARFGALRDLGLGFVRIVPGSRDMPGEVAARSIQALGRVVSKLGGGRA